MNEWTDRWVDGWTEHELRSPDEISVGGKGWGTTSCCHYMASSSLNKWQVPYWFHFGMRVQNQLIGSRSWPRSNIGQGNWREIRNNNFIECITVSSNKILAGLFRNDRKCGKKDECCIILMYNSTNKYVRCLKRLSPKNKNRMGTWYNFKN